MPLLSVIPGAQGAESFTPKSVDEARACLAQCAGQRRRVGFVGGGTALGLGNPSSGIDLVLHARELQRIVDYAPEDQVIVAEAGVTLAALQDTVSAQGQWFGVDAPYATRATLGGLVAVGGFGPRRARYGAMRDLLLGLSLVRADGVLAKSGSKVVKNVAGFDVPKLMCGALGTLGFIAEVTLRLHPRPEASATVVFPDSTTSACIELVKSLRQVQLEASSVVALRVRSNRHDLGIRFEGFEAGVVTDLERCARLSVSGLGSPQKLSSKESDEFWAEHERARTEGAVRLRVAVLPTAMSALEPALEPVASALEGVQLAWYASLGLAFLSGSPGPNTNVFPLVAAARERAVQLGGSLVVESAATELTGAIEAWGPPGSAWSVMRELKQRFDPEGRLNPGRFVAGL